MADHDPQPPSPSSSPSDLSLAWAERLVADVQIPGLVSEPSLETSAWSSLHAAWRRERGWEVLLDVETRRSSEETTYEVQVSWPSGGGPCEEAAAQAELACRVTQLARLIEGRLRTLARGGG